MLVIGATEKKVVPSEDPAAKLPYQVTARRVKGRVLGLGLGFRFRMRVR